MHRYNTDAQYLAAIVRDSDDAIIGMNLDGIITTWNGGAERIYGYTAAEALGQPVALSIPPDREDELPTIFRKLREGAGIDHYDTLRVTKAGRLVSISLRVSPVRDEDGTIIGASTIGRDVTRQKEAESALRAAARGYQLLMEQASDAILISYPDQRLVGVNERACAMFGYAREELLALTENDIILPDTFGDTPPRLHEILAGKIVTTDRRVRRKDGTVIIAELSIRRLDDGRIVTIARDITARKRAEEALRQSEAELRALFAAMTEVVIVLDREGRHLKIPATNAPLLYRPAPDMLGKTLHEVLPQGIADILLTCIRQALDSEQPVNIEYNLPIVETEVWFRATISPISAEAVLFVAHDITADKHAEDLRARHVRHATLRADVGIAFTEGDLLPQILLRCAGAMVTHLDAALTGIWTLDRDENVLQLQASAGLHTQIDGPDSRVPLGCFVIGRIGAERRPYMTNDVLNERHIGNLEWAQREGVLAFAGYPLLVEDRLVGVVAMSARSPLPAGTLDALGSVADILAQGIERKQAKAALYGLNEELEDRVRDRTAELAAANTALRSEIAERQQIEVALRKAQAVADAANQAKSEFLSRMSHELRTPLNAILGFAQLLELAALAPREHEGVTQILKGGRHLLGLINEVLDIARIEAGHLELALEPVAVADLLQEAVDLVRPLAARQQVALQQAEPAYGAYIWADRQRMVQVLLNLLANAVKYNREAGTVTLGADAMSDGRLRILVSDTGPGLEPAQVDKLFTPFERLGADRTGVEGTGLGLALARRLVEAMAGEVGVTSTPGQGSTFWVDLRRAEMPPARREPLAAAPAAAADVWPRTVLCIEDNLSNLRLIEHILLDRPATQLLAAMQGQLGLELARDHQPDLILLDLHLPDVQGDTVLQQLQANPRTRAIPVVMLSADATPHQVERLLAQGARAYLTKPIDVHRLLGLLSDMLGPRE